MKTTAKTGKRTVTFYSKACPRCKGDMYKSSDSYGAFMSCYQCGHEVPEQKEVRNPIGMPKAAGINAEDIFEESA